MGWARWPMERNRKLRNTCGHLVDDKGGTVEQQGKESFQRLMLGQLNILWKITLAPSYHTHIKQSILGGPFGFSVKDSTQELLEDDLGDYLRDLGEGKGFLN